MWVIYDKLMCVLFWFVLLTNTLFLSITANHQNDERASLAIYSSSLNIYKSWFVPHVANGWVGWKNKRKEENSSLFLLHVLFEFCIIKMKSIYIYEWCIRGEKMKKRKKFANLSQYFERSVKWMSGKFSQTNKSKNCAITAKIK